VSGLRENRAARLVGARSGPGGAARRWVLPANRRLPGTGWGSGRSA